MTAPARPREVLLERILDDVVVHGLGDRSLRDLAAAAGTSHRMLIYHFGSREGLVAAIVDAVEARQRMLMATAVSPGDDPADVVRAVWARVSAPEVRPFVQLFFETVAHASRTEARDLTQAWLDDAARLGDDLGVAADTAQLRLGVAVIRGLLVDVVAGGDVQGATEALESFLAMWTGAASAHGRRVPTRDLRP
jgi:AcrR family transcriptional regulator